MVVSVEASDAVAWSEVAALDPDPKLMLMLEVSAQLNAGGELLGPAAAEPKMLVFLLDMFLGVLRKDGVLVVSVNEIGRGGCVFWFFLTQALLRISFTAATRVWRRL